MDVWTTDDPQAFLDRATEHLAAEPLLTNVLGVVADRLVRGTDGQKDPWFACIERAGAVVGAAMHTAPMAYVGPCPDGGGEVVAAALLASGRTVTGVVGAIGPAAGLARTWTTATGESARVTADEGVHLLRTLTPPDGVAGAARPAGEGDLDLVARWYVDFCAEAFPREPPTLDATRERVRGGLSEGRWLLWETDDGPVSLAGRSGPVHGVGRVGPVWTPPEHRRHGYAAMVTAAASQALLDDGAGQVMLFTDLANPTSNGVYARLGYVQVDEAVEYTFG